jgi:hypothetical protein
LAHQDASAQLEGVEDGGEVGQQPLAARRHVGLDRDELRAGRAGLDAREAAVAPADRQQAIVGGTGPQETGRPLVTVFGGIVASQLFRARSVTSVISSWPMTRMFRRHPGSDDDLAATGREYAAGAGGRG